MSLEMISGFEALPNQSVVVDFAIDCKGNALIFVSNRLRAAVDANNTQSLVSKNWPGVSHNQI
jgi:hypothetical protein